VKNRDQNLLIFSGGNVIVQLQQNSAPAPTRTILGARMKVSGTGSTATAGTSTSRLKLSS
jgi:hypothetical protein